MHTVKKERKDYKSA